MFDLIHGPKPKAFWYEHCGLCAAAIIALTTAIRLYFVWSGQLDLVQDEAQYWTWTRVPQWSYYSKGPLIAWLISGGTALFGDTELGVRFPAILGSAVGQAALYLGMAKLFNRPLLGLLTVAVANTMPLFLAAGILMTTDNPLLWCWFGALMSLYAMAENPKSNVAYVTLAVCIALGILAKYMMFALVGMSVIFFFLLWRHGLTTRRMLVGAAIASLVGIILGMTPILIWNAQNDWVGFRHVATLAGVAGKKANVFITFKYIAEYLGGQLGVVTPWWLLLMLITGWRAWGIAWSGKPTHKSLFMTDSYANNESDLTAQQRSIRQCALLSSTFLPLWFGMTLWSLHTRIYTNWPAMCYVSGIILAAAGAEQLIRGVGHPRWRRALVIWFTIGAFIFGTLHLQYLIPLPEKLNPTVRLKGWADLGCKIDSIRHSLPNPNHVFFFSSAYDMTSAMSFYIPDRPTVYCANFGRRMAQYDLWPSPLDSHDRHIGWDAVFVLRENQTINPRLLTMFESATSEQYLSAHKGGTGRTFTIITLRNFNGVWPSMEFGSF
ncbi:MAG: glycosyltransferase family 39 protein [Pseudomonadota bacterium]